MNWVDAARKSVSGDRPVLIAGPTAGGKSELALAIAQDLGAPIINADALQVYQDWRILTARPSEADENNHRHELYGHVAGDDPYSVGRWLRDVAPIVEQEHAAVIVGGTGLYFSALTEGLADIPATPQSVRSEAEAHLARDGLKRLIEDLDSDTREKIDLENPMRVQRAWEVQKATGRGLAAWQAETGAPLLPLTRTNAFVVNGPTTWLNERIEARFDGMLQNGALDEARRNEPGWTSDLASAKAIGAPELVAYIRGEISLEEVREAVFTLTRQYAKRQRSWLRGRMQNWVWIDPTKS
ncbi:MAG: tRNA (adenosine(37)-N6)-dimethylallyltransferase MiaA [Boseongicola sp.]